MKQQIRVKFTAKVNTIETIDYSRLEVEVSRQIQELARELNAPHVEAQAVALGGIAAAGLGSWHWELDDGFTIPCHSAFGRVTVRR